MEIHMEKRMTPPLKVVKNDQLGLRAWCGPTVIAAITGKKLSEVKAIIKAIRGSSHGVRGTGHYEVREALRILGYRSGTIQHVRSSVQPTIRQWMRSRTPEMRKQTIIVNVTHHWVVVRGNKFLDTFTNGQPVNTSEAPRPRKRVENWFAVWPMTETEKASSQENREAARARAKAMLPPKKRVDPYAKSRAAFRKEMDRLGGRMTYYVERGLNRHLTIHAGESWKCTKWAEWEADTFYDGDIWADAVKVLKTLKPKDFRFTLKRKAA
jgi:hypothetical protein